MQRRQRWLLAGLGLPVSAPFLGWLAQAPAHAEQQNCLHSLSTDDAVCDEDSSAAPPPVSVRDISIVSVEPVRPAQEPAEDAGQAEAEPNPEDTVGDQEPDPDSTAQDDTAQDDTVQDDTADIAQGDVAHQDDEPVAAAPDNDQIRPAVADDMVGGVGSDARKVENDWRMDGADLGVVVDLGENAQGQRVLGYVFGDATSRIQPFSHGGPDMDAEITWANPMLYTHLDQNGNEVVDGFADEDDVPAYPGWSTRWVWDSLQAAGTAPEPPPLPDPGRKGLPVDLIGRGAAAGTPDGAMLDVVRSIGGKAKGNGPASIVPTSAIVVDDKLFVAFQVANNWDVSAQWTTLQSQIVQFDLDPDTRRIILPIPELPAPALVLTNPHGQRPVWKPKDWNRGDPFQQMEFAMVDPADGSAPVVYIGGTQEGRANDGLHMARSSPEDLLDPGRWEYYTAKGWQSPQSAQRSRPEKPLRALPVTPPLPTVLGKRNGPQDGVGESSLLQVGQYLVFVYTRNTQTPVAMRLAPLDHPTEFGPELAVVTGDGRDNSLKDPRGVYGGFLSSAQSEGDTLVATISHWGGYGTYQVRITLNQPLGSVFEGSEPGSDGPTVE